MDDHHHSGAGRYGSTSRTPKAKYLSPKTLGKGSDLAHLRHSAASSNPPTTAYSKPMHKCDAHGEALQTEAKRGKKRKAESDSEEKRLRRFRPNPPQNFFDTYSRALTQRFFVISRQRCGTNDCPEEVVELAGSTGNIYTVRIATKPTCTCPHAGKGHQCKHVLYVMSRVLRARFDHVYQLALLSTELQEIFAGAPAIESTADGDAPESKSRKPVEGDCPICFCEFEPESKESIVWCRAACGQNVHKECFETWAATKRQGHGKSDVTCPFCRSVWQGDDELVKKIKKVGAVNHEGYVNVADQLGISTWRGLSTKYEHIFKVVGRRTGLDTRPPYGMVQPSHDRAFNKYRTENEKAGHADVSVSQYGDVFADIA